MDEKSPSHCVCLVTVPDQLTADAVAEALVSERLAACVNIAPGLTSVYCWQGSLRRDAELLLIIKTRVALVDALTERIIQLHPYATPEVIASPLLGGSAAYLAWVDASTA